MKDLLVTITDKNASFGRVALTAACRGHNNKGVVLNYFIFEASMEAKRNGINKDEVEYIEIERTQEMVLKGIHGATQSKKTLTSYTNQFQEWRFIEADPYHHKYRVYFKNIQAAIDNPPPVDPPKPRGVHTKKDGTNGKNTISPNGKNTICNHEDEIAKLRFEMVKMSSEIAKLRFEMVNLRNERSSKASPEAPSSGIFEPLESIRLLENTKENIYVSSDTSHTQNLLTSSSQLGDTNVPNTSPLTSSNGPDTPTLSSVRSHSGSGTPDHSPSAPAPSASEKQVEQESRQDGQSNPIVNGTTKDEEKNVGDVTIREEVTASLTDFDMSANNMQHIKPKIKGNTSSKKKQKEQLTLQGQHIIELYQAYKKRKVTLNDTNIKAANGLGDVLESDEDFNEVLTVIANDKFIKDKGVRVDLDFVYRKYDGYLDVVDRLRQKASEQNRPIAATPGSQQYVDLIHEAAHAFLEKEPEDVYAAFM